MRHCNDWSEVYAAARRGEEWTIGLVYFGTTAKGGKSQKYWTVTGRGWGRLGDVVVRWGRCGTKGQSAEMDMDAAEKRYESKRRKGYDPAGPEFTLAAGGDRTSAADALLRAAT